MDIRDVENLSVADLKAKRAEVVAAVKGAEDLAERFVSARLDAKLRDEKLSEQGETIRMLQEANAALESQLESAQQRNVQINHENEALKQNTVELNAQLQKEKVRADRLHRIATVDAAAITQIAQLANHSIAQRQVDAANEE